MRIQHNIMALNAARNAGVNQTATSKNMEKLSSGFRINRAGDDAAGLSISEKMRAQIRGMDQASRNASDGISMIQTAEGGLQEVSTMLTRMKELAVQKANGTYSTNDTNAIDAEVTALTTEVNNIISNTSFNGKTILDGTTTASVVISEDAKQSIGIAAAALTLTKALTSTSTTAQIDAAISEVNTQRATYGAQQNQLEHTITNLSTTSENLTAAESRIRDVDMAKEMVDMTKNNILSQAAQAMISQANQQPQSVLSLLR